MPGVAVTHALALREPLDHEHVRRESHGGHQVSAQISDGVQAVQRDAGPDHLEGVTRPGQRGRRIGVVVDRALQATRAGLRHALVQARDLLFPREPSPLSAREQEVLELLAAGLNVNEVAERCGRSPKTISRQKAEAKRKLGLQNNQELFDYLQTRRG